MRIQQPDIERRGAARRVLRYLHRVQHRIQQIERDHHKHPRQRIGALQLPGHARRMRRGLLVAGLRVNTISLDVFVEADVANGKGIGIGIGKMRPVARIRFDENHLGVDFERRAHGFGEGIARLHGHIDGALVVFWIRIKDHRHLRQPRQRLQVDIFERSGQLDGHDGRPIAQNRAPHFDGEFEPARNYRKIGKITAAQTGGIFGRP